MTHDDYGPPPWMGRRRFGPPVPLPLVVGAVQVIGTLLAARGQPEAERLDLLAIALLMAGPVALLQRRRYPTSVLLATLVVTHLYLLLDYPRGPVFLSFIVAFFSAVMRGRRVAAWTTLGAAYLIFLLAAYYVTDDPPSPAEVVGITAWLLVLATVAEVIRTRRERYAEESRTRAEEARRRASEERLRIAQDLHDVLAHNISLINVQAGVALHLIDERPEQARSALSAIKEASNEALGELRSVLDILRRGAEHAPRSPTAGLGQLDDLLARTNEAGLTVTKRVEGEARPVGAGVDRAAFRIVQEALTNVVRHAANASVTVLLAYGERDLVVEIEDDGSGSSAAPASGGGRGIAGMTERAASLGGRLEAGPRPHGGWRVRAVLPLAPDQTEVTR